MSDETPKMAENSPFFTKMLLKWNQESNTRMMPWKAEKDPYKIWLSEIILQQTRVEQGMAYYQRFILKYPTIRALAIANDTDVFKLWEGLGYYARCRNMLFTARFLYNNKKAVFPSRYEDILALKGIGTYTAAAIASFAFNLAYPVIDGNVTRVISRFFGIREYVDLAVGKKIINNLAYKTLDRKFPGKFNQAIMDFGATVCKPVGPLCNQCPLSGKCLALFEDQVAQLPRKMGKVSIRNRYFHFLVIIQKDQIFIRERMARDIWQHLHEFVLIENEKLLSAKSLFSKCSKSIPPGISYSDLIYSSGEYKQQLSHQCIHARFILVKPKMEVKPDGFITIPIDSLQRYAFPRIITKWLAENPFYSLP